MTNYIILQGLRVIVQQIETKFSSSHKDKERGFVRDYYYTSMYCQGRILGDGIRVLVRVSTIL